MQLTTTLSPRSTRTTRTTTTFIRKDGGDKNGCSLSYAAGDFIMEVKNGIEHDSTLNKVKVSATYFAKPRNQTPTCCITLKFLVERRLVSL